MISDIAEKLETGERLSLEDGVRLFEHPDLLAVGALANRQRERRHGDLTYYNFNIRVEATNVCVASCLFCSFARLRPGDPGSYTMALEDAWEKLRTRHDQALTEVHVVNGLHPDLPFEYYLELLRGFKRIRPEVHLKCFTAVEIAFFADLYGMSDEQVLRELEFLARFRRRREADRLAAAAGGRAAAQEGSLELPGHLVVGGLAVGAQCRVAERVDVGDRCA